MSPPTRPVRRPSLACRTFEKSASKPSTSRACPVALRNPPLKTTTLWPASFSFLTVSSAPGIRGRFRQMASTFSTSSPSRSCTRVVRLSKKSSSPRIARSVMTATFSMSPRGSARKSMVSPSISVESKSKTISFTWAPSSLLLVYLLLVYWYQRYIQIHQYTNNQYTNKVL